MNKCLNCDSNTKNKKFCNNSCSATYNNKLRIVSDDTKEKISNSLKNIPDRIQNKETMEKFRNGHAKWIQEQQNKLLNDEFNSLCYDKKRKRIIIEQNQCCNRCNNNKWFDNDIPLEIDHIDGDNSNDIRENMIALCPNCHALTDTWRGRNKKIRIKSYISDKDIVNAFLECGNIRKTLIKLGLAAKGANYGKIKRALTLNGIDYNSEK